MPTEPPYYYHPSYFRWSNPRRALELHGRAAVVHQYHHGPDHAEHTGTHQASHAQLHQE